MLSIVLCRRSQAAAQAILLALVLLALSGLAQAGERAGIVREVRGKVTVDGKPAKKYQTLSSGQAIVLSKDGVLVVDFFKNGLRQKVQGEARLRVNSTGFKGNKKIEEERKARFQALAKIGAQKKMGGGSSRAGRAAALRVSARQTEQGPVFEVFEFDQPSQEPYFVALSDTDAGPLAWSWEKRSTKGPKIQIPTSVLSQLKIGTRYSIVVGEPGDFQNHRGHELRFQMIPAESLSELKKLRADLADSPASLMTLMEVYDSLDMVWEARDLGIEILSLPLSKEQKQVVSEAVEVLSEELLLRGKADSNS